MKFWQVLLIILISATAGYFLHSAITKPKTITEYKIVEVIKTAAPDTVTIKTVDLSGLKAKDKEIADLRHRVSIIAYNKLSIEKERDYFKGQVNDLTIEINNDTTAAFSFVSQKTFFPDKYSISTVLSYAPCPPDSLQNALTVNYEEWLNAERMPEIKKEMARGHLTWGAVGFAFGAVAVLIWK